MTKVKGNAVTMLTLLKTARFQLTAESEEMVRRKEYREQTGMRNPRPNRASFFETQSKPIYSKPVKPVSRDTSTTFFMQSLSCCSEITMVPPISCNPSLLSPLSDTSPPQLSAPSVRSIQQCSPAGSLTTQTAVSGVSYYDMASWKSCKVLPKSASSEPPHPGYSHQFPSEGVPLSKNEPTELLTKTTSVGAEVKLDRIQALQ